MFMANYIIARNYGRPGPVIYSTFCDSFVKIILDRCACSFLAELIPQTAALLSF